MQAASKTDASAAGPVPDLPKEVRDSQARVDGGSRESLVADAGQDAQSDQPSETERPELTQDGCDKAGVCAAEPAGPDAATPAADRDASVSTATMHEADAATDELMGSLPGAGVEDDDSHVEPPVFATVEIDEGTSLPPIGNGDLWASCWADDDALYVAAGDGRSFGLLIQQDIFVARIDGWPGELDYRGTHLTSEAQISSIWNGSANFTRKPTGMLCIDGDLYVAVQDLAKDFDEAPAATITRSSDKGRTWSWDRSAPMFSDHVFTTIMFLDYGKNAQWAPSEYVYAYGLDGNWAFRENGEPGPTRMYLGRVPKGQVQSRQHWEFFAGMDESGEPRFSADIGARAPVLEDTRRVWAKPLDTELEFHTMTPINQGGVIYNAPLDRYIYTSWTEYTFELYEAPAPWGPFHLFYSKDFGIWPWTDTKNGGYATTIPSKFISEDGKHMLVQANSWLNYTGKDNYQFALRSLRVEPYQPSEPDNEPGPTNLASADRGAVRVSRALRSGHGEVMNDGVTQDAYEDSYNGEAKQEDYWGYTWATMQRVNTLRYTTGQQRSDGGHFEQLGVQVRKGKDWVDVPLSGMDPQYPADTSTPAFTTYTLRFEEVATDGIRLYGKPGGSGYYTSLAELSVHLE